MVNLITEANQSHIVLLHNKQDEFEEKTFNENKEEIKSVLDTDSRHEYFWLSFNPSDRQMQSLIDTITKRIPFKLKNLVVPEVVYEREEIGEAYDEVVAQTTKDEGRLVKIEKDTGHTETKRVINDDIAYKTVGGGTAAALTCLKLFWDPTITLGCTVAGALVGASTSLEVITITSLAVSQS